MIEVPLICDPVPGPHGIISSSRVLSAEEVRKLRQLWSVGWHGALMLVGDDFMFRPLIGDRTEWPDAEFCAA